ncbi:MAG TPA: hypothetical protein VJ746_11940 [Nitrospira sp.]|nr:hypothetical protein [Nitrospira sp.]
MTDRPLLTLLFLASLGAVSFLSPVRGEGTSLIGTGPLPLQFTAANPETLTTTLHVTVPAGATASTLIVNCFDCDHTDWGSLSINGGARIALWPGPGPSYASGTIRIPVPVSAWKTGSNTLAFTHSQYTGGRVDGLSVSFAATATPPTTSTTPTSTAPSPSTTPSTPSSTPTTQPTTPPTTSPSVPTTGTATLSWNPVAASDLAGYKVFVGTASGVYNYPGSPFTIGVANTYTITLPKGQTYFFAVSDFDTSGNNSGLSNEVSKSLY